jgi:hypothetical protein
VEATAEHPTARWAIGYALAKELASFGIYPESVLTSGALSREVSPSLQAVAGRLADAGKTAEALRMLARVDTRTLSDVNNNGGVSHVMAALLRGGRTSEALALARAFRLDQNPTPPYYEALIRARRFDEVAALENKPPVQYLRDNTAMTVAAIYFSLDLVRPRRPHREKLPHRRPEAVEVADRPPPELVVARERQPTLCRQPPHEPRNGRRLGHGQGRASTAARLRS